MTTVRNTSASAAEKGNKISSCTLGDVIIEVGLGHSEFKNIQYPKEVTKFVSFPI